MTLYRVAAILYRPLVLLIFRPKITGREHVPGSGGCVVAANHLSGFDIFGLGYALFGRNLRNMAKNQLFRRRFVGPLVRSLGAFPAQTDGDLEGGVEKAAALARAGEAVAIFPTGARRRLGERRPRTGAARTALEAGVPLVPAGLGGTDGWRRLTPWRIAFGPPIPVDDLRGDDPARAAREATRPLSDAIAAIERSL